MARVGERTGRPRLVWVVHQYGTEVGGGSETLCRQIAELLVDDVDSTVLSTAARTYSDWSPQYPLGESTERGVRVIRFAAEPVDPGLRALYDQAFASPHDPDVGRRWLLGNGPNIPQLVAHLKSQSSEYDVLCSLPYVYPTTLLALETFTGPRVLVPCAHDEPALALSLYDEVFRSADVLVFNSEEEEELIERRFGVLERPSRVIGTWIDRPPPVDARAFAARYELEDPYVVSIGRLDMSKGTDLLLAVHAETLGRTPPHTLVLVGHPYMEIPDLPQLLVTGFVDEQTKQQAIAGASAVILPSPYESLSIVALEGWTHGRPALANADCPVLLGQCRRSGGGLWYHDANEYAHALTLLLTRSGFGNGLGASGRSWAIERYSRERVRAAWLSVIRTAMESGRTRTLTVGATR